MYFAVFYNENRKDNKGAQSKKKSNLETEGDFKDDFEDDFDFSTAVKKAVDWIANNPSDDNDNPGSEGNDDKYCTISIDSAVTRHRACGLGRIRSLVPRHNPYGRRILVDPKNSQKRL